VLDSGVGGLTVLREVRAAMPAQHIIYVGDDAGFPYGGWDEESLVERLVVLFGKLLGHHTIDLAIVACNTASTLIMPSLRERFDIPFVGTVPAIKPAAERTASGMVSVLATPGTISRRYTRQLIADFAADVDVNLVASIALAPLAEDYMRHRRIDTELLSQAIAPSFLERGGKRTDIVVLGCTHYPFLVNEMRKLAPWPVDWIDPAEAIALRALDVLTQQDGVMLHNQSKTPADIAYLTSNTPDVLTQRLLRGFGLEVQNDSALTLGN